VYLFALLVKVNPERWVFLLKPIQGTRKVRGLLSLRCDCEGNHRFGDEHRGLQGSENEGKGSAFNLLTIERLVDPSVKVSPEEHSTPKIAQISPGPIDSMSYVDEKTHEGYE